MYSHPRHLAVIALLAVLGCNSQSTRTVPPSLEPVAGSLHFGEAWEQSGFRWQVRLRNQSSQTVTVQDVQTSCKCIAATPQAFVVEPGQTATVDVTLDLRQGSDEDLPVSEPRELSEFSAVLRPKYATGGAAPGDTWRITGHVRRSFYGVPSVVDFGDISQSENVSFMIKAADGVSLVDVRCDAEQGAATFSNDDAGLTTVRTQVSHRKGGRFEFPMKLIAKTGGGVDLPPITIPVTGRVVSDVMPHPAESVLGLLQPGQVVENTILIRSRSGQQFDIESVICSDDRVEILPSRNQQPRTDGSVAYIVKVSAADKPGDYSATVGFQVQSDDQQQSNVSFRLTYTVGNAAI